MEDMDLDELLKEIPLDTDVPPKDAASDIPQKKTITDVPSTSAVPLNLVISTSVNTTATVSLNTETSSNATRKLHNNINCIICYLYLVILIFFTYFFLL